MSVEPVQRKSKRAWRVRYRDYTGKAQTETYDLKADALARDAAIKQAKQRREPIPRRGHGEVGQTFARFAHDEWWPEAVVGRNLTAKTQEGYGQLLDKHLVPRIGDDSLVHIDVSSVLALQAKLAADKVPNYTSARALKLLRQILGFAVIKGRLSSNPADYLRERGALPSQARTTDIRPMPPEQTEALRLAILSSASPNKLRDATLVSLIAYAGLRPQEALALRWENVSDGLIRVEHANVDGKITRTKTGNRRTIQPLIPTLTEDLKKWRKESSHSATSDLVIGSDGEPWTETDYQNWRRRSFNGRLPESAPKSARVYDLRHGYASLLVREGVDIASIAKRLGHSPTMTTTHYTHVFEAFEGKKREPMATVVKKARMAARRKAKATG